MPNHPDRIVLLQGASNFRDLGGYPTRDGRVLRWRRLFRSAHLAGLTEADRALLAELGLVRSFDFRGASERAETPYELAGLQQVSLAIEPTVAQRMQDIAEQGTVLDARVAVNLMKDLYRGLINSNAHRFAQLFEQMLDVDEPMLFHCTAGKDRTGVAAALILLALGVDRDLVVQDYLLTNRHFRAPRVDRPGVSAEVLAVFWQVQQGFLDAAFELIDAEHGGIDAYLHQRLGLSQVALDALRKRYLQPLSVAE